MTAASISGTRIQIDRSRLKRPGLLRLTRVEMRKMVDTRSGFWLLLTIAAVSILFVAIGLFAGEDTDRTFYNFFQATLFPVAILLPVLGIMMVTSEWSQRTTLTTFSLVPRRAKVMVAKFLAGIAYALLSMVTGLAMAAIGHGLALVLGLSEHSDWHIKPLAIAGAALFQAVLVVVGISFGMLLMNTPAAIVLYFVLPTALTILAGTVHALKNSAQWLDITAATGPLADNSMTKDSWAHLGTSALLWIVLPIALGSWRLSRRELK